MRSQGIHKVISHGVCSLQTMWC
uniref:Uncharacterized protein n=1 Tax=Arundo donax TaxID=35708 RepID=A0A0A9DZ41_ARUDO